jgi:hypothetical protein
MFKICFLFFCGKAYCRTEIHLLKNLALDPDFGERIPMNIKSLLNKKQFKLNVENNKKEK